MKTFRVDAKLRNNLLIRAREALGFQSCPLAAKALDVSYHLLVQYESLKRSPWRDDGTWKKSAIKIADGYRVTPDTLWPEEIGGVKQTRTSMEIDIPEAFLLEAPKTPEEKLLSDGQTEVLHSAVSLLTPKEQLVLNARFGLDGEAKTFSEIGAEMSISRERVRQIEIKALSKLRGGINADGEPKAGFKERLEAEKLTSKERRDREAAARLAKIAALETENVAKALKARAANAAKALEAKRLVAVADREARIAAKEAVQMEARSQLDKDIDVWRNQTFAERGFKWVVTVPAIRRSGNCAYLDPVDVVCALKGHMFTIVAGGQGSFDVRDQKLVAQLRREGWYASDSRVLPCDSMQRAFAALGVILSTAP